MCASFGVRWDVLSFPRGRSSDATSSVWSPARAWHTRSAGAPPKCIAGCVGASSIHEPARSHVGRARDAADVAASHRPAPPVRPRAPKLARIASPLPSASPVASPSHTCAHSRCGVHSMPQFLRIPGSQNSTVPRVAAFPGRGFHGDSIFNTSLIRHLCVMSTVSLELADQAIHSEYLLFEHRPDCYDERGDQVGH